MHSGERTVDEPDMLYSSWVEKYEAVKGRDTVNLSVTMRPLVYTYLIRYEFERGAEHIALARGAIAGVAESVYLKNGTTGNTSATLLFDCNITDYGVEAKVGSFGAPGFSVGSADGRQQVKADDNGGGANRYSLNLEVMLKNGSRKTFEFDIAGQMQKQPRGGVIRVNGLVVTDEEAIGRGGNIDAGVSDWGEFEDIVLPLI